MTVAMTVAIIETGALGLLALVAGCLVDDWPVLPRRADTTAARHPLPVTRRVAVDPPTDYLGRHRA